MPGVGAQACPGGQDRVRPLGRHAGGQTHWWADTQVCPYRMPGVGADPCVRPRAWRFAGRGGFGSLPKCSRLPRRPHLQTLCGCHASPPLHPRPPTLVRLALLSALVLEGAVLPASRPRNAPFADAPSCPDFRPACCLTRAVHRTFRGAFHVIEETDAFRCEALRKVPRTVCRQVWPNCRIATDGQVSWRVIGRRRSRGRA